MMTFKDKINYIHATLQECQNNNIDDSMIEISYAYLEEMREVRDEET
jgi:cytochrome c-type biogenesis protein CcmH/NrfF